MQNAAIEMHWLMVNHVSRLKKAEKPKMLVWRTEFGRGVFFGGKLNKPCGYWFCQKWLLIISKRPKKSSEWCYFNLTPPTDHGTILRRSPLKDDAGRVGPLKQRPLKAFLRANSQIDNFDKRLNWKLFKFQALGRQIIQTQNITFTWPINRWRFEYQEN